MTEAEVSLKFLQKVDLSKNKLTKLPKITSPSIKNLILDENEIAECEFSEHPNIKVLSLNKNKLASGAGIHDLPKLEELSI